MSGYQNDHGLANQWIEGQDYRIETRQGLSGYAFMAPHGGRIEPGTDLLASDIAGLEHSFYAFNGIRPYNNSQLHITSHCFDEPRAMSMLKHVHTVITLHGCRSSQSRIYIGGLNTELKERLYHALRQAGLNGCEPEESTLGGIHPQNLCNRGLSGRGIQLEITAGLRRQLGVMITEQQPNEPQYSQFITAVRHAIDADRISAVST